jgi:broad specificity phosphatase PhoE
MLKITFEAHATTVDNEAKIASGWHDAKLSGLGIQQAKDLGERRKLEDYAAVFCSDLERAYQTAIIAFGNDTLKIFKDWRLRECNYGDFTHKPSSEIEDERPRRVDTPFPNGQSYADTAAQVWSFLGDAKERYDGQHIMLIGHRATHYALDYHVNDVPLEEAVARKFSYQPGWEYELD